MRTSITIWWSACAVAIALALTACRSSGDSHVRAAATQSRALPGLTVKLSEYAGGDVIAHSDDTQHPTHAEKVGVSSRLTLEFHAPQLTAEGAVADPRW